MTAGRSTYLSAVEYATALLLLVYPVAMLTVRGGMNAVLLLTLLLALLVWLKPAAGMRAVAWQPAWTNYALSMSGLTVAVLVSQLANNDLAGHPHDAVSRFWLAIPVFWLLLKLRATVFKVLQFAFPLAAVVGWSLAEDVPGYGFTLHTLDKIHFGDYLLLLGTLSLFTLDWFGRDRWPLRLLKLAGFVFGLLASLESGTRGGWLAIPVFLMIFLYFGRHHLSFRLMVGVVVLSIASMAGLYTFNDTVSQRVNEMKNDIRDYQTVNQDTSIGIRWQLYGAALDIFSRHPIVGVGPSGFAREMQPMMEAGKLTSEAANYGRGEVHNDILAKTAGMGILGLVAICAIYIVPLRMFWHAAHSSNREARRVGVLGLTFVMGTVTFGLSAEFLNLTMAAAFYAFTVSVLLAACNVLSIKKQQWSAEHVEHSHTQLE